jgi:hypothetical protein
MGDPVQPIHDWLDENQHNIDLSKRIQRWSIRRGTKTQRETGKWDGGNFGEAARALNVTVQEIADAVEWHYWMFTMDTDWPLPIRRIEHEGE